MSTPLSNPAQNENQAGSLNACPHCGSVDIFTEPRPPHVALVCRSCGRWIRWVPKGQAPDYATKDRPSQPALKLVPRPSQSGTCDHSRQLDILIESLNRVDRN